MGKLTRLYGRLTLAGVVAALGVALLASSASAHRGAEPAKASRAASSFGIEKGCRTPLGVKPCWVAGVYNGDYTGMNDRDYVGPPAQASGGHPFVGITDFIVANTTSKGLVKPNGTVKSIRVDVPAGLVSNPEATPRCTSAQLTSTSGCPTNTQLGTVELEVLSTLVPPGADVYVGESVYNMKLSKSNCAGYTADYAFYVSLLRQRVDVCGNVHKDPPYNLYFTIKVPSGSELIRSTLDFWGVPGDTGHAPQRGWSCVSAKATGPCSPPASGPSKPKGQAFLTNPTGCVPKGQITKLTLKSTTGQTARGKSKTPVPSIDCSTLPFAPRIKMVLSGHGQTTAGKHPTLTADATQTAGQANIKFSQVTLPLSLALDPLNSEHVCSVKDANADKCPASTLIGSARATTPLLSSPLSGKAFLVQGYRTVGGHKIKSFPAMLIELRGATALDLHAQTSVNKHAQLVTAFPSLPDLPMSSFALTITGGKKGILVANNNLCRRAQKAGVVFTGHNGATKRTTVTMPAPCKSS